MSRATPKVFLIGAQKCGTTSLAKLLSSNTSICVSQPKEPNYYTNNFDRGAEWYRSCFSESGKVDIDASTTYTMCPLSDRALKIKPGRASQVGVPARIFRDSPDARFLYIIRDPVKRLYSNYWHNVKYGYETADLEIAIANDPQYLHLSEYYGQLEKYLAYFPAERMHVVKFEDFVLDKLKYLNACERFIGVDETKALASLEETHENKGGQYNSLTRRLINSRVARKMDRYIPGRLRRGIKNLVSTEIPAMDAQIETKLSQLLLKDQQKLEEQFSVSYLDK